MELNDIYMLITKQKKKTFQNKITNLGVSKIQKLIHNPILKDFTVIFSSPKELVFDERAQYCCKMKCKNYNSRCYCPPYSLNYQKDIINKNIVVIFIKTYDFSELNHFKNYPNDYNKDYIFKKRVFVRRWVQSDYYKKIKQIFKDWGINSTDLFTGGFSMTKCCKCYSNPPIKKKKKSCIPMPSPEALGIDVLKSLDKLNYYLKFGVSERLTKVSMIFTNDFDYKKYLGMSLKGNDKSFKNKQNTTDNILDNLIMSFKPIEFKMVDVKNLIYLLKDEYKWLEHWKKGILWKEKLNIKNNFQELIHKFIFMKNNYFALDFKTKLIFKESIDYEGIEFI